MRGFDRCPSHLGRVGRRTKLTADLLAALVEQLQTGCYVAVACRAVGLPTSTFETWVGRGAKGEQPYAHFAAEVEAARARGEARCVEQISAAGDEDWRAASWLLERQYPDRWGKQSVNAKPSSPSSKPAPEPASAEPDPFAEVDELAKRRSA